ncbi:hypothetical protein C1J03_08665 [Sulfitobacter sp. SK012]|nr:hypothetical protein C1J03_08665 [Sulfitobacter sp. SK012]
MSHAYFIWTMQRTGGTTLAILLRRLSEHPSVEDEPFNLTRVFGHIILDRRSERGRIVSLEQADATGA